MGRSERALVIVGVFVVLLLVMAIVANVTNSPWLMIVVPVGFLIAQAVNRHVK